MNDPPGPPPSDDEPSFTQISAAICGLSLASACISASLAPAINRQIDKCAKSRRFHLRFRGLWERMRHILLHFPYASAPPVDDETISIPKNENSSTSSGITEVLSKSTTFNYSDELAPFLNTIWRSNVKIYHNNSHQRSTVVGNACITVEYAKRLVPDLAEVFAAPFYWGRIDRHKAEDILQNRPEGTFILRDSAHFNYLFSISFRKCDRTLHARIEFQSDKYGFDRSDSAIFSSSTISELITHYRDPKQRLFFEPQLSHPLHRNSAFSLADICRAKILSCCDSTQSLEHLSLPNSLVHFLQELCYKQPVSVTYHDVR